MGRMRYNEQLEDNGGDLFPDRTVCVVGNARTANDNPITHAYSHFFMTFVADIDTGLVVDVEASFTLPLTNRFVRSLFLGRPLDVVDEDLLRSVRERYLGSSQKAISVAYKDAVKKFVKAFRDDAKNE